MCVCAAALLLMGTVSLVCPAAGQTTFSVSVTKDVYQAEEHGNVTLTWLFPVNTDMSAASLQVDIMYVTERRMVYLYNSQSEAEPFIHELYRGRMRCDLELIRTGRIECLFTDLRLNDTGTYSCIVVVNEDNSYKACDLNVTAAATDQHMTEPSKPASRGRIGLIVGSAAAVLHFFLKTCSNSSYERIKISSSSGVKNYSELIKPTQISCSGARNSEFHISE